MSTKTNAIVECRLCGEAKEFFVEEWQLAELAKPRSERMYIQDIFPDMPVGDRELFISNTCDTCWKSMFGTDEEEA